MRVLFVEDNLRLSTLVRRGLENEGFTVDGVGTIADAEAALDTAPYDVVILDLGLPDGDGLDLLRGMRAAGSHVPVLVLTARLRALLRRPDGALGLSLCAGNVTFDTSAREVRVGTQLIKISKKEMGVLEQLMRRTGRVVPKDMLESKLYGFDDEVSPNSLEANVSRLRKRLALVHASVTIHTLRGVGYLLSDSEEA